MTPREPPSTRPDLGWRRIPASWQPRLAVVVGGAIGTLGRWGVSEGLTASGDWPWATFVVNLIGAFALAWILARLLRSARPLRVAIPFLGIGVLGGFTTFSAFAHETWDLMAAGSWVTAAFYAVASVTLGLGLAVAGTRLAES